MLEVAEGPCLLGWPRREADAGLRRPCMGASGCPRYPHPFKAVKSQPAAKNRSPRTTTKAAAPFVTSAAPETTETGASAS
jgi:hypothetical protein